MVITASYPVDKALYFSSGAKHTILLSTTEYTYRNDMLVHVRIGKNTAIRLSNLLRYECVAGQDLQDEWFLGKKTYNHARPAPITRSTFDEKLRRFDLGQTVIEQEIVEEYAYADQAGNPDSVQIVVRDNASVMMASVDFKDAGQYKSFVGPAWLSRVVRKI